MMLLRRDFLRLALRAGATAFVTASGVLKTAVAFAASWNKNAFESKAVTDALNHLGASGYVESRDIAITAPDIAENGAVVPIAVNSKIPNTQVIAILAEKNPFPLAAVFDISNGLDSYVSTRLKIGQTTQVRAIVKADGKVYSAAKEIKVTVGGCG